MTPERCGSSRQPRIATMCSISPTTRAVRYCPGHAVRHRKDRCQHCTRAFSTRRRRTPVKHLLWLALVLMAACTPQSPPRASKLAERLTTDARESFLGFQNNTSTFVTCAGTTREMGHGTVEPPPEPCPSTQPYTPIALSGTIKAVDPEQHTLTLETEQGKQVDLFVPATAAHNAVNLREFKQHD